MDDMNHIDFTMEIKDPRGQTIPGDPVVVRDPETGAPVMGPQGAVMEPGKPLTLGDVSIIALGKNIKSDTSLKKKDRVRMYELGEIVAQSERSSGPVAISREDCKLLSDRIADVMLHHAVVGFASKVLDAPDQQIGKANGAGKPVLAETDKPKAGPKDSAAVV